MSDINAASANIGIIAAGGRLPFAVADALVAAGRSPVVMALKGLCSESDVARYRHHWVSVGQLGRLFRLLCEEKCHEVVFIGTMVRPALSELKLDFVTLRAMPRLIKAFRGGDDQLLSNVGALFEQQGFKLRGAHEVAPHLLMPAGCITRSAPDNDAQRDIDKGTALLAALSPFDVGQAVVVIDGHVVGVEGIEGTDALLSRVAQLRVDGRLRSPPGRGVLVKAPKVGQDLRLDMPTVGPGTIEGVVRAGLAGLAVTEGRAMAADAQKMIASADSAKVFVVGIAP